MITGLWVRRGTCASALRFPVCFACFVFSCFALIRISALGATNGRLRDIALLTWGTSQL